MMLASTVDFVNLGVGPAAVLALLGYAVVFFGLILLMCVVTVMGKVFQAKDAKAKAAAPAAAVQAAPVAAAPVSAEPVVEAPVVQEAPPAPTAPTAPGSAGGIKLYDVEPKTAAMLMAIVADKMGKPLNELRFISIKEVQ